MKRWPYLVLFFTNAVAAALLVTYGQDILKKSPQVGLCNQSAHPNCISNQTIYRASMVSTLFFWGMMLLSALHERGSVKKGWVFGCQLPFFLGCLTASFFIPNVVFDGYSWAAAILSGVFIVMQIVILLDCVYGIRDSLLDCIDDPKTRFPCIWRATYLGLSLIITVLTIAGLAFLYHFYAESSLGLFFLIVTTISIFLVIAVGVADCVGAGLLPPTAISLYLVFLLWLTLAKMPDYKPSFLQGQEQSTISIPSTVIAALTVSYTGWRTSCSASSLFRLELPEEQKPEQAPKASQTDLGEEPTVVVRVAVEIEPHAIAPSWQFHCIMLFSSIYMAMALTNWGLDSGPNSNDSGAISMWVQIASQWLTTLIFLWSLVAPLVFPNRDFT